jgi:hypothetical protein
MFFVFFFLIELQGSRGNDATRSLAQATRNRDRTGQASSVVLGVSRGGKLSRIISSHSLPKISFASDSGNSPVAFTISRRRLSQASLAAASMASNRRSSSVCERVVDIFVLCFGFFVSVPLFFVLCSLLKYLLIFKSNLT